MQIPFYSVVIWSIFVSGFGYFLFIFFRFYQDLRRRAHYINRLPGDKPHWLLGHLKNFPGPNEAGLKYLVNRSLDSKAGIAQVWMGPFLPNALVFQPNSVKAILKTSGPNEAGLKFILNRSLDSKADIAQVWMGPFVPNALVFHPNSVKAILKTSEPKPRGIGGYSNLFPWLGDGLLLAGGQKWARNRRLLTPAFHFDILRPYMTINNRCTDIFLEKLEKFAEKGEYFEVFSHVSLLTLDIVLRCAFSYEIDCQVKGDSHPYVHAVSSLGAIVTHRFLSPWLYPDFTFNLTPSGRQFKKDCDFVHKISDEIIQKRNEVLKLQGTEILAKSRHLDFLDVLLTARDESGQGLSDQEIRDEADTFLFEGHDTTSSGISWALHTLASQPEAQAQCQKEIDEVLSGKENKDIEWDDLPKLKYLTMCLKEALRLHSPVPFIERILTKDIEIEGHLVPAGTIVDIQLYVLHRSPSIWKDPDEFRPERFSPENQVDTDHYAFLPFSAGPRNCIGQHFAMHEMKTAIARVLSRFTLTIDPERPTLHQIALVMKTENGMYMKATSRRRSAKSK